MSVLKEPGSGSADGARERAVTLRAVRGDDLPVLFRQQLDPEATRLAAFPPRDEATFFAHWQLLLADPSVIARAIVCGDEVAGHVGSFDADGTRQVGYWVGRELWGRGIASRALAQLLALEPRRPLHAHVAKHNRGSIRVLEKCGFVVIGEETSTVRGETAEELVMRLDAAGGDAAAEEVR